MSKYLIETGVLRRFLLTLDHDDELAVFTEAEIAKREAQYFCEYCGWLWPTAGEPPAYAECDNCGGQLEPREEKEPW